MAKQKSTPDHYSATHPELPEALPPGNRSISQRGAYLEGIDELIAQNRAAQQGRVGSYAGNEGARQRQIELEQAKADYITGADGMEPQGVDAYGPPPNSPDLAPATAPMPAPQQAPAPQGPIETSRTVTSRQLHPDAQAHAQQQYQRLMKQATMVGETAELHRETGKQISMQMQAIDQAKGKGIDGLEGYMHSLSDAYTQADADLASLRVDPDKWEKETPVLAQVLLAIAAGAAGFATGGRGPNPIVQLIENAIDRDIGAQEKNIAIKIRKGKMGIDAAQRLGHVRSALTAAYVERALDGLSAIKMNAQTEMAATTAAMAEQELGATATQAMTDYYNSAVQTSQSTYSMTGGAEGLPGKWDDNVLGRAVVNSSTGVKDIAELYTQWKSARVGGSTLASRGADIAGAVGEFTGLGSTDMHEYDRQKQSKVLAIAAEYNKGRPTDKDFKAVAGLLPTSGVSEKDAARRIGKLLSKHFNNINATYQSMSASDRKKARESYVGSLKEIVTSLQTHPEVAPHISGALKAVLSGQ